MLDGEPCDPFDPPGGGLCFNIRLPTPWSAEMDPENPLPEYPRPQLRRERWKSLNGIWEFEPYGWAMPASCAEPPKDFPNTSGDALHWKAPR